jgi:hypothetical protein
MDTHGACTANNRLFFIHVLILPCYETESRYTYIYGVFSTGKNILGTILPMLWCHMELFRSATWQEAYGKYGAVIMMFRSIWKSFNTG